MRRSLKFGAFCLALQSTLALASPAPAGSRACLMDSVRQVIDQARSRLAMGDYASAKRLASALAPPAGIRIYADYSGAEGGLRGECQDALQRALESWRREVPTLDIDLAASPTEANWSLSFQRSVRLDGCEVAGVTRWNDGLTGGTIQVRTEYGRPIGEAYLVHELTHEIGHVLGLDDSCREGCVMGPLNFHRPAAVLTDEETTPVRELQAEAHSICEQADLSTLWASRTVPAAPEPAPLPAPQPDLLTLEETALTSEAAPSTEIVATAAALPHYHARHDHAAAAGHPARHAHKAWRHHHRRHRGHHRASARRYGRRLP